MSSDIDLDALVAPFRNDEIEWRIGNVFNKDQEKSEASVLAYMDARAVMSRLDDVCGIHNWQVRFPFANGKTCCEIGIWLGEDQGWVWKANGAGDTQIEGDKGAFTDALKRAASTWGIGRYLYDMPFTKASVTKRGRNFFIDSGEYKTLNAAHDALVNSLGCSKGTHTGNKAIDDWVKERVAGMASYANQESATIEELDKKYSLLKKHAIQSRVTGDQLFTISDQYANTKIQITNKEKAA